MAMVAAGDRQRSLAPLLMVPAALLVLAVLGMPLVMLFRYSLNQFVPGLGMAEALTLANYGRFFSDSYFLNVLGTTVQMAILCTALSLILAFPVAYFLARTQSKYKSLLIILTVFPLLVGNVVRAAGWMALLGNSGFVNTVLIWFGLVETPVKILYTPTAVVIGIVAVVLPFMILTLQSVIESIDRSIEEAALNLGASPFTVFRRVTFPLSLPGVLAGTVLVGILCMNAYATPVLLGGSQFKMMAPALYDQMIRANNWPFGAALAFVLMVATVCLTIASTLALKRRTTRD
ncbi:MAG: ABC transporter permease [Alphaproteobacteria bacterium]|nr:ABC transporter permease [Alphaproteobacteria bacterium]